MPHNIHKHNFYFQYYPEGAPQHMDILPEEVVQEQHVVVVVDADMVMVMVAVEAVKVMVVTLL